MSPEEHQFCSVGKIVLCWIHIWVNGWMKGVVVEVGGGCVCYWWWWLQLLLVVVVVEFLAGGG